MFAIVIEDPRLYNIFTHPASWAFYELQIRGMIWLLVMALLGVVTLVGSYLYCLTLSPNPATAFRRLWAGLTGGLWEILSLPFGLRRVWAIAYLGFKEAIRRRVLYVFLLFTLPFLFAGWYLPNSAEGQLQSYVAFVHYAIGYFLMPLTVFLVSMSLPNDIQQRTIQTVVTKPVRRLEIVLGRIIGFMAIFTLVLAVMGGISLIYLRQQIGNEETQRQKWTARVPVYATSFPEQYVGGGYAPNPQREMAMPPLIFMKDGQLATTTTPDGRTVIRGTHVGKEWDYRSHIEGNRPGDSARWYFNFNPALFASLPDVTIECTFNIFKTTKGNPTRADDPKSGVLCRLTLISRHAVTGQRTEHVSTFRVNNNRANTVKVPATLFEAGELEVVAHCLTTNQFLGMAAPDLYFLARQNSFEWNFVKGLFGIWLTLLLLVSVAVAASTALKGFVTVLLVVMVYLLGLNYRFLMSVVTGQLEGGGPIESLIRLVTQNNQVNPLEGNIFNNLAQGIDKGMLGILWALAHVVPDLSYLDTASYVAEGFNIPPTLLVMNAGVVFGYILPVIVAGFFLLRAREIAT